MRGTIGVHGSLFVCVCVCWGGFLLLALNLVLLLMPALFREFRAEAKRGYVSFSSPPSFFFVCVSPTTERLCLKVFQPQNKSK